ncbi:flagellar assembly protein H [Microcoleus sp. PH2017_28_MFU_U_A]|uniref:flagellar assembly protein H n=1 Tax=Microcoleus sp. PH2017_28_MFU_U_A TaxID=2798838 RepID=UPI001D41628A|nr:flagellar assembly protein H [Microcoleus sp. PH2017_28_MFU_U_A]MCC3589794.1 flagellar assembly protein H [Microcoleus sp. PH2017_28_MFU_U_A]
MTRFIHDRFAKEFLEELLSPIGTVNVGRDVTSEVREIDVYFTPGTPIPEYSENLGLLGKMAGTTAIFEPFRNPVNVVEAISCIIKLWNLRGELQRGAKRKNTPSDDAELPRLWILTPTASKALVEGFGAIPNSQNWVEGIYFLPGHWESVIVVIHQLPETPETLWLRILGKGKVQERAIAQMSVLATDDPLRITALELLYRLQSNLVADIPQKLEPEERELIMAIAPLFREQIQAAQQQAREEGLEQGLERGLERGLEQGLERGLERGRQEQQRLILENFLRVRFGELSPKMTVFLSPISKLFAADFTVLLLAISMLTVDESGRQEAVKLLAESVLKMFVTNLEEIRPQAVTNLLALPIAELTLFVEQLPQLSDAELRERLVDS